MEKLYEVAQQVVNDVCKIKQNERVLIITNHGNTNKDTEIFNKISDVEQISLALYEASLAAKAIPTIIIQPEKTQLEIADDCVIDALKTKPSVVFSISENKLGGDKKAMQTPFIDNDGKKYKHIFDYLLHGTQEIRAVWTPGISVDMFERTAAIDYFLLERRCSRIASQFEDVDFVHVTSPSGTDITVPVAGREIMSDDGNFSSAGSGGNIPAGEVFISPVVGNGENTGCQGKIVFDGSISLSSGDILIKTPIVVDVKNGFVTNIEGGIEAQSLLQCITEAEKQSIWMEKEGKLPEGAGMTYAKNARNIGELGIGLNPSATISGNMLEDEKAFHTCHFAIGANYDGDAESLIHLDALVKNPTIVLHYAQGNTFTILKDGVLVE